MSRNAAFLCQSTGGRLLPGRHTEKTTFDTVSIDTRTVQSGAAFFCLSGPNFDAHDFIEQAAKKASIIIVKEDRITEVSPNVLEKAAVISVTDPEQALADGAQAWRNRHQTLTVVGLTGSSGKTTTKEFVAAGLSHLGPTLATTGNLNNHLGVPLTLFRIRPEHQFAVIEMGMNAPGEIEFLTRLASPSIGIVTTVGRAHTEGVGSIQGVARAKGELLRTLPKNAIGFFPSHIEERALLTEGVCAPCLTIGEDENDHLHIENFEEGQDGAFCTLSHEGQAHRLNIVLSGRHNLENASLAVAVGLHCGGAIDALLAAMAQVQPPKLRGEKRRLLNGTEVVLDCYNANPQSMRAAVTTFVQRHPRGVLALGDMLELGESAEDEHRALGQFVARSAEKIDLVGVGDLSRFLIDAALREGLTDAQVCWVKEASSSIGFIAQRCAQGRALLLKGSRGMKLETIWDSISQSEGV